MRGPLVFDPKARVSGSDQTIGELRDGWKKKLGKKYAGTSINRQPNGSVYYLVKKYKDGYHGRETVVAASYGGVADPTPPAQPAQPAGLSAPALAAEAARRYAALPPSQGAPPIPPPEDVRALIGRAQAISQPLAEAVSSFLNGGKSYSYRMVQVARGLVDENDPAAKNSSPETNTRTSSANILPAGVSPAPGTGDAKMQRVKIVASGRNFEQARKYLKKIGATYDAGSQTWAVPAGKELDADQHRTWGTLEASAPVVSRIGGVDAEPGDDDDTDRTPY